MKAKQHSFKDTFAMKPTAPPAVPDKNETKDEPPIQYMLLCIQGILTILLALLAFLGTDNLQIMGIVNMVWGLGQLCAHVLFFKLIEALPWLTDLHALVLASEISCIIVGALFTAKIPDWREAASIPAILGFQIILRTSLHLALDDTNDEDHKRWERGAWFLAAVAGVMLPLGITLLSTSSIAFEQVMAALLIILALACLVQFVRFIRAIAEVNNREAFLTILALSSMVVILLVSAVLNIMGHENKQTGCILLIVFACVYGTGSFLIGAYLDHLGKLQAATTRGIHADMFADLIPRNFQT